MTDYGRFLKSDSFWVGACLDWAFNRTWALGKLKKLKSKSYKKCRANRFFTNSQYSFENSFQN